MAFPKLKKTKFFKKGAAGISVGIVTAYLHFGTEMLQQNLDNRYSNSFSKEVRNELDTHIKVNDDFTCEASNQSQRADFDLNMKRPGWIDEMD